MSDFKKQIEEDLIEYQAKYPNIKQINKLEWAFNFWILDKLYSEDEDLIEEKIVDYNDKGIDCYVWHEDSHDLYLIQNKYYDYGTSVTWDYVFNDFLTRAIGALEKGTYTRSKDLQDIFNKYSEEEDFKVYFNMYITNDDGISNKIRDGIKAYNENNKKYSAHIYMLCDIESLYYNEPIINKKKMTYEIKTINKGTMLSINNDAYKMTQALDAKYVMVPVFNLYLLYKKAMEMKYPIFDANIREYLGATGSVNKKIMDTLKDPTERVNFFYYNNGITMIVDGFGQENIQGSFRTIPIENPQIVNGCQTVSTIYETLNSLPVNTLEENFENTYVMAKILQIPSTNTGLNELYKNIVTYNNSQNAINDKTFVANSNEFKRVQDEFERKGFLICIKQSDKHSFMQKYKVITTLVNLNAKLVEKYGLKNLSKTRDFQIDLEKFLQVLLAFNSTTRDAIQNKSKLLKADSEQNKRVIEFIKNPNVTINAMVELYLLYLRAEQEKKSSEDGKTPIPLYLINCFGHYECAGDPQKICDILKDKDTVNRVMDFYKMAIKMYYETWKNQNADKDYNAMIKSEFEYTMMDMHRTVVSQIIKI